MAQRPSKRDPLLIRGAQVIDVVEKIPTGAVREILIEDGRIAEISESIDQPDAEILEAEGSILMPGFVDTHRHTWETQLRGLCGNMTLGDYALNVRLRAASVYLPDDVRVANYVGAIEAVNSGVTSLLDFSHVMNSPDHADAAIEGLERAGVRSLFCYGYFPVPGSDKAFPTHDERFRDLQRIAGGTYAKTIEIGAAMTEIDLITLDERAREIQTAMELGLRQVFHTGGRNIPSRYVRFFEANDLLADNQIHVHCNEMDADEWAALARAGCKVSISPETELNMGMGYPVFAECADHGVKPTLSCDITAFCSGEMFTQMRMAIAAARHQTNLPDIKAGRIPARLQYHPLDAIRWATLNGAEAMGIGHLVGSVEVGKVADLILIDTKALGTVPVNDAASTVVFQARSSDVHTVLVDGKFMKRGGHLVGVDIPKSLDELATSAIGIGDRAELGHLSLGAALI